MFTGINKSLAKLEADQKDVCKKGEVLRSIVEHFPSLIGTTEFQKEWAENLAQMDRLDEEVKEWKSWCASTHEKTDLTTEKKPEPKP